MRVGHFFGLIWILAAALLAACSERPGLNDREVATRVLADYLANEIHPRSVLVISNPFSQMDGRPPEVYAFEEAGIAGLTKGFSSQTELKVGLPKLNPAVVENPGEFVPAGSKTPVSFLLAPGSFDQVVASNPQSELVVSLIGLPANLSAVRAWSTAGKPAFALLLPDWALLGTSDEIRRAFKSGKLAAAVINRPRADEGAKRSNDYKEAFAQKFILVTAGNIDELLGANPELFKN